MLVCLGEGAHSRSLLFVGRHCFISTQGGIYSSKGAVLERVFWDSRLHGNDEIFHEVKSGLYGTGR